MHCRWYDPPVRECYLKISLASSVVLGAALAASILALDGCSKGKGGSAGTVAMVNSVPISQDEYMRYMMLKPSVLVQSNRGPQAAQVAQPIGFQALQDLVRQKLLVQIAKDMNVYPSPDDITKEIDFRVKNDPSFVKRLNAQGLDTDMIKQALAIEMSQFNVLTKGVTVAPDEIDKYIKDNPTQFTQPASIDLLWIVVRNEQSKKQADDELRSGQPFEAVATRYSEARDAKTTRGEFAIHQLSQLPKELQGPISATADLHSTDWIKAQDGWAKFYVQKRSPAKPVEITPTIREMVRRRMLLQKGSNASDLTSRIDQKMSSSKIEVDYPGLQEEWSAYQKQLQDQAAPPSLQGTVPGAGGATPGAAAGTAPAKPNAAPTGGK